MTPAVREALKTLVKKSKVLGGSATYSSIIKETLSKRGRSKVPVVHDVSGESVSHDWFQAIFGGLVLLFGF